MEAFGKLYHCKKNPISSRITKTSKRGKMETIQDFNRYEKILQQFALFKPNNRKPTFMEICQYPGNRFEEISSRILQFYLNPHNPHGLKNLFIKSLMETLIDKTRLEFAEYIKKHKDIGEFVVTRGPNSTLRLFTIQAYENFIKKLEATNNRMQLDLIKRGLQPSDFELELSKEESDLFDTPKTLCIEREVGTENDKRIDLLAYSDSWVVCIENKIFADDYNPFGEYRSYVEKRFKNISEKRRFLIVLSLKKQRETKDDWIYIYYRDFIRNIKKNIGDYLQNADNDYLACLMDWIKTLEYKQNNMESQPMGNFTDEEYKFFCDEKNSSDIEKLLARKREFDEVNRNTFLSFREVLRDSLNKLCNSKNGICHYWEWQDRSVVDIDVETSFGHPFIDIYARNGKCRIEIATREWLKKTELLESLMDSLTEKLNKTRNPQERIVLECCELQEKVIVERACYWVERLLQIIAEEN